MELVEKPGQDVPHLEFLRLTLPDLKNSAAEKVDGGEIAFGAWYCNLGKAAFHVTLEFPNCAAAPAQ